MTSASASLKESKLHLIENWLLGDSLQPSSPAAWAGGVPGWWIDGEKPQWVYLEITGYYLTTLAFIAMRSPALRGIVIDKAHRSVEWMNRVVTPTRLPPTRLYASEDHDWRNRATFSFDLGMALRGAAAAVELIGAPAKQVVNKLLQHLQTLVGKDDVIESHHMLDGSSPEQLAPRWSTRRGPHHVKVAGAIALATEASDWHRVARATTQYHLANESVAMGDLHPCAYFLEGLLQMSLATRNTSLSEHFEKVFQKAISSQPIQPREGLERGDVTAQFTRLHAAVSRKHEPAGLNFGMEQAARLDGFISHDGSVRFHKIGCASERGAHVNTWAAMFAYQALAFREALAMQGHVPAEWIRLVI